MKTHSGTLGGGGQPVAHDDSRDVSTSAAIKKPTLVLMGGSSPTPVSSTDSSPDIRLTMLGVRLPVLYVLRRQCLIPDDQQVLGVLLLGGLGEVETSRDDEFTVDDDHLVMRNRMLGVDHRQHALVREEVSGGILLRALALIRMTCTRTPRLWALSSAFAIGAEVKL
jgi:hypothetical protein